MKTILCIIVVMIGLFGMDYSYKSTILGGHSSGVNSVAFSPDGKILVSAGGDGINFWDPLSKELLGKIEDTGVVQSIAFSPDGKLLAAATTLHAVELWDVASMKSVARLTFDSPNAPRLPDASCVTFSPDGKLLAVGNNDDIIRLWDVGTRKCIGELRGFVGIVGLISSLAFSPDGKLLASGAESDENNLKLWDVASQKCIATLTGDGEDWVWAVAFSPDGKILASGGDDTVRLWDVSTLKVIKDLKGHYAGVSALAFSPDGKLLADGGVDGSPSELEDECTIRIWDIASKKCIAILKGHTEMISSLAFSPDGKLLASGGASGDATVRIWEIK